MNYAIYYFSHTRKLLPLLFLLLLAVELQAQLNYTTNSDGTLTVASYTGSGGAVVIPDTINGRVVTSIGVYAFWNGFTVTSVTIPTSVTSIGGYAFNFCSSLTNIVIPNSVTNIGDRVFYGCTHLASIAIPNSVTRIGISLFSGCSGLADVTIGNGTSILQSSEFFGCTSLTNVTIPSNIKYIEDKAFDNCTNLYSVIIGSGVTNVDQLAFYNCGNLTKVYFQGNAPKFQEDAFGPNAFLNDPNVTIYYVPGTAGWGPTFDQGVTYGPLPVALWYPFQYVTNNDGTLTITGYTGSGGGITIPSTINGLPVTSIGPDAFRDWTTLGSIIIPNSVTNIGQAAFSNCTSLTSITIPSSVAGIGSDAFNNCTSLTVVYFQGNAPTDDPTIFNGDANIVYYLPVTTGWGATFGGRPTSVLVDLQKPTLTLASFISGLQVSNAAFSVSGTAGDNVAVATVFYSVNDAGWNNAATANNWNNWSAVATLVPGTNTIRAYAMDISGNLSSTNTTSLAYVASAILSVSANGSGSLSPNYNGALLQIGKTYTITAKAGTGFAFTNWTDCAGNLVTNKPVLTFTMVSNSCYRANFVDVVRPILAITNLVPGQRLSNSLFTVKGRASDNLAVSNVWYQLNGGGWLPASGTNKWLAALTLTSRSNVVQAFAVDTTGNLSTTSSVSLVYVQTSVLTETTSGSGMVTPNFNGQLLEIGGSFTTTARAGTGFVFSNWVDGAGLVLTNQTAFKFTMQSNLVLTANFIPNPFLPVAGNYAGLFYDTNQNGVTVSNAGYFTATVTSGGGFTAKLQLGAKSNSFSGVFSLAGNWATSAIKGATNLGAQLQLDLTGGNQITGQISNNLWTAQLVANRSVYSKTNPAPQAGQYTLVIPGSADPANLPGGHGAVAVNVSSAGTVSVNGILGDGTVITESTFVSPQGQWPLYAKPYSSKGILLGWMTFTNDTTSDLAGVVSWIKPGLTGTKIYPTGFDWPYDSETNNAFGSAFTNRTPLLNWTNGVAILENGNLAQSLTNGLVIGSGGKITGTNKLSVTITTSGIQAGLFKGSVVNPVSGKTVPINGALLQKQDAGFGSFSGTNQTGSVSLEAQ